MPSPTQAWAEEDLVALRMNYLDERSSAWMYRSLADRDDEPERTALLRELSEYEEKHADLWENLLEKLGRRLPPRPRLLEHRILVRVGRLLGVGTVLPILHKGEVDGIAKYKDQAARWKDPDAQRIFPEILPDEISHEIDLFHGLREVAASRGTLRSAILGANDGSVSILALAAGIAGATGSSYVVVIGALAGLVAGAVSMGASNYVSVKAEQEVSSTQARLEREAIAVAPDKKRAQLEAAYTAKGLTKEEAQGVVARLSEKPGELLKALLAEQHGISETSVESPPRLAGYTALSFAIAGLVPIIPFVLLPATAAILPSVALTAGSLFLSGLLRALSTLRPFLRSGLEMVLVGLGAAAATYLIGLAVGGIVS